MSRIASLAVLLILAPTIFGAIHASASPAGRLRPNTIELAGSAARHSHDCPICKDLARTGTDLPTSAPLAVIVSDLGPRASLRDLPHAATSRRHASAAPRAPPQISLRSNP